MIDPANPDYLNTPASSIRARFGYLPVDLQTHPCVSIITSFYNTGDIFEETALSVMRQSLQQWEWIIVNDASSHPDAKRILDKYRQMDPRIRVIDFSHNQGPSAARNRAFREARSEYVAIIDSDDLIEPTALEKWAWFLESHPECSFVTGCAVGFGAQHYLWAEGFHSGRQFLRHNMLNSTTMVRKSVHNAVGGYREEMRIGLEDWDFWLHCADRGYWGDTIPEYLHWYRRRDNHGDRWENLDVTGNYETAARQIQARYAGLEASFPVLSRRPLEIYPLVAEIIPFDNHLQKTKKRLLILIPWMTMGGADKFNLDLVSQLSERDWEITIVATLPGDNCWHPHFSQKTPDIFILNHFLKLADWPRFICYLIASRQIDHVLITNSDFGYSILPYLKEKFPNVVFTDYCHMEEEYWKNGGYPRRAVESQPLLDMNIVSSEHLKEWMARRGAESVRIKVCYTNINTEQWQPHPENKAKIRTELKIDEDVPIILYAGRIHPQKQPRVFAKTLLSLRDSGMPFAAVVAGDGPELQWLQNFLVEHRLQSHVKLLGAISNDKLRYILQGSDIFFLPSMMEGISLAIFEAMSCGVTVVGADVGGQKELVTPACGFLISKGSEPAEAEAYASIILNLLKDPAKLQAMGKAGRQRIVNAFELKDMGRRMQDLLLEASDWSKTSPRLPVNPGLGQSLVSMAIDYHRIEKLLRDVWPFYVWAQRNHDNLEILFQSDKLPSPPDHTGMNLAQPEPAQSGTGSPSDSLRLLEQSIYNLFAYLPERVLQTYLDADIPAASPLMEDILIMRHRILREIGRWHEQRKRIAIYGIGTHTQALLGTLPILMPLVKCFIDRRASAVYLGRPCIPPDAVQPSEIDVIIYSSKNWEADMYRNLEHLLAIEHVLIYASTRKQHLPYFSEQNFILTIFSGITH